MCHSIVRHRGLKCEAARRAVYQLASLHHIWTISISMRLRVLWLLLIGIQRTSVAWILLVCCFEVLSCCALGR